MIALSDRGLVTGTPRVRWSALQRMGSEKGKGRDKKGKAAHKMTTNHSSWHSHAVHYSNKEKGSATVSAMGRNNMRRSQKLMQRAKKLDWS